MTLLQLTKLTPASFFTYKGAPAKMVWSERLRDPIYTDKNGDQIYWNHFGIYFKYKTPDGTLKDITFVSGWPHENAEFKDFENA